MANGKPGRPSLFTPELVDEICERLSEGEPLAVICRDEGMPSPATVRRWQEDDPAFSSAIARARVRGFDAIAEECYVICNTPQLGERVEIDAEGQERVIREDMLGHRKLQIETRLKLLAKWDPKRYGERLDLNHSGKVETGLMGYTDAQLEQRLRDLRAGGAARPKEGEGES